MMLMNCPISLQRLLTANMRLGLGRCEIAAARIFVVSSVGRSEKDDIGQEKSRTGVVDELDAVGFDGVQNREEIRSVSFAAIC